MQQPALSESNGSRCHASEQVLGHEYNIRGI